MSVAYYHIDSDSLKNVEHVCNLMELLFPAAVAARDGRTAELEFDEE